MKNVTYILTQTVLDCKISCPSVGYLIPLYTANPGLSPEANVSSLFINAAIQTVKRQTQPIFEGEG